MKRVATVLLVLGTSVIGQSDSLSWLEFFPMHIGDRWQYNEVVYSNGVKTADRYTIAQIAGDSTAANGKRYFYFNPSLPMIYAELLRFDTLQQRIYAYAPDTGICYIDSERLVFDFILVDSSNGTCPECYDFCEVCQKERRELSAFKDTFVTVDCRPPEARITFAAPIGLIGIGIDTPWGDAHYYSLVATKINGVTYGEFVPEDTDNLWFLDYFPMHIGDRWQYEITEWAQGVTGYQSLTITGDTVMSNGRRYFVFSDSTYCQIDTTNAILYKYITWGCYAPCPFNEWDEIDFSVMDSSILAWEDCWYGSSSIHDHGYLPLSAFEDTFHVISVYHEYEEITRFYACGLGLLELNMQDYIVRRLIAAQIDGNIYGKFVAVERDNPTYPLSFMLYDAYPNPFNPITTIRYDLPQSVHVQLIVYNLLGREVARLVDQPLEAGIHYVVWNGKGNNGSELPSGIYIARLVALNYTKSIKMLLLK
ncbi:MAG: T9SS type A sorting domain-containing protein [Candidatus Neomarinimicrobiota bacterium]